MFALVIQSFFKVGFFFNPFNFFCFYGFMVIVIDGFVSVG